MSLISPTFITWNYSVSKSYLIYLIINLYQYCYCCLVAKSCPAILWPHGLQPARLLCPWDVPGKNNGVSCHFLLQGIFLTQGLNTHLLHCRQIPYHWATSMFYSLWHNQIASDFLKLIQFCPLEALWYWLMSFDMSNVLGRILKIFPSRFLSFNKILILVLL